MKNIGVLIVETNGLDPKDSDILQILLTGAPGYLNTFAPYKKFEWDSALNGLMPEALVSFSVFSQEDADELTKLIAGYDKILVYNGDFIYNFLTYNGVGILPGVLEDVMVLYSEKFENDSYEKRLKAMADYGITDTGKGIYSKALSIRELYVKLTAKPKKRTTEGRDGP